MYKLIISDLDGTLLNSNHKMDSFTKDILHQVHSKGVNFVIATGRTFLDAVRVKNDLGLNVPMITTNGAALYDENNKELYRYDLPKEFITNILKLQYKNFGEDIVMNSIAEDKWYIHDSIDANHKLHEWEEENWKFEYRNKEKIGDLRVSKIFFIGKHEELEKIEKYISNNYSDIVNFAFTLPFCFEIYSKYATKGEALKKLAEIKKYNLKQAIAFGDGLNDLEMLALVKKAYTMKNASPKLKKALSNSEEIGVNYESAVANKLKELFEI